MALRIGIEAQRLFREQKHGIDFVALEIIRALQEIDKENTYYIFVNKGPDRCLQETRNFKIIQFGGWYPVWEQILLPVYCKRYKLDLLHCTSNLAPIVIPTKLFVTVHDIIYLEGFPFLKKGFSTYQRFGNLYRQLLAQRVINQANKIITVSYSERKQIINHANVDESKLHVIPNALASHFKEKPTDEQKLKLKEKYRLPAEYILFLGNTDPKKNTSNTIRGFLRCCENYRSDVKLVVADLSEKNLIKILSAHKLLAYRNRIYLCGYVQNEDMPALMNQASIFLYTSKRESFGIPILEAMSQGVPVISSCAYSMPEVAEDAAALVNPEDVDDIARNIHKLMTDQSERGRLIEAGMKRYKQFSWIRSAELTLKLYLGE